jgi:hypothetical protein
MTEKNDGAYTVRLLRPEDAAGVTNCFIEAFGHSYPTAYLYDPQRIAELNREGQLISAVAVANLTGEVVAHCSVQRYGSSSNAECGQGVVAHAHRGGALTGRLFELLNHEALRAGLRRLMGHEVTNHPAMQLMASRDGYNPCALALGAMPAETAFKKMTETLPQRESCTVSMKFLVPPEEAVVCVPSHHRTMLERIYTSIGRTVVFKDIPAFSGPGETTIQSNPHWGIADIQVRRIGTDTLKSIRRCLSDLCETNTEVVYLELPLDQGGIEDVCRAAEADGFFFAGLSPSSVTDGESLFLQYLNTEIDMSHLRIATPMGKEIFDYVARERQRVQR